METSIHYYSILAGSSAPDYVTQSNAFAGIKLQLLLPMKTSSPGIRAFLCLFLSKPLNNCLYIINNHAVLSKPISQCFQSKTFYQHWLIGCTKPKLNMNFKFQPYEIEICMRALLKYCRGISDILTHKHTCKTQMNNIH